MNLAARRRLAATAVLSLVATGAAVALTTTPSSASVVNVTPSTAGNYPGFGQPVTVTFTLTVNRPPAAPNAVPPGSQVTFTRVGSAGADDFTTSVTSNSPTLSGQQQPKTSVDLTNPAASDPNASASLDPGGNGNGGPANPGDYDVTFVDPTSAQKLDSCTNCFHVVAAGAPTVTALTPARIAGGSGGAVKVKATGTNLASGTTLTVSPPAGGTTDVTVAPDRSSSGGTTADGTSKVFLFTVPATAVPGPRDVQVINTDGKTTTCTGCFTVLGANLTGVSPGAATNTSNDNAQSLVFTGPAGSIPADAVPSLAFIGNAGASTKDALSIPATTVTSRAGDGSSITAVYNLDAAAPGDKVYVPTVTSVSANSVSVCSCTFSVVQPAGAPTLSSITPANQDRGTTQTVTVNGTNFAHGTNVAFAGGGVTTTAVEYVSRTQFRATISVASTATSGARDVTVTNTDGSISAACKGCYTVNGTSPAPSSSASASSSPCPSTSASASPSTSGSPTATTSASPTASATATASMTPSATASSTASASSSATASSASATGTPGASGCPSPSPTRQSATLVAERSTINAGESVNLFATGQANEQYSLQCYTRPSTSYTEARAGAFNAAGDPVTFTLSLGRNTRCFLRYVTNPSQGASNSSAVNVKTVLSLSTVRQATRKYLFQGRNLPRVAGQLITLYRVDNTGQEIRTSNLTTDDSGIYKVTRTFTGTGTFRFKVRTSQTLNNAAGVSNTITVTVR